MYLFLSLVPSSFKKSPVIPLCHIFSQFIPPFPTVIFGVHFHLYSLFQSLYYIKLQRGLTTICFFYFQQGFGLFILLSELFAVLNLV